MKSQRGLFAFSAVVLAAFALTSCSGAGEQREDSESREIVVTPIETSESNPTSSEVENPAAAGATVVTTTTTADSEGSAVDGEPAAGSCDPSAFQAAGFDFVDRVAPCDGQWAKGGKDRTDYYGFFHFSEGAWRALEPVGVTQTGMSQACYDVDAAASQGAPGWLTELIPAC